MANNNTAPGQVWVFNTTATNIYINANNGAQRLRIYAASTIRNWRPTPLSPPLPLCSTPAPGVIGIGRNSVSITPESGGAVVSETIIVPDSVRPGDALQLYLAAQSTDTNMWMLLCNGSPVASNIPTA